MTAGHPSWCELSSCTAMLPDDGTPPAPGQPEGFHQSRSVPLGIGAAFPGLPGYPQPGGGVRVSVAQVSIRSHIAWLRITEVNSIPTRTLLVIPLELADLALRLVADLLAEVGDARRVDQQPDTAGSDTAESRHEIHGAGES